MKRKLYIDELESFLAESADDVRMYPSDRVWRQIDKKMHGQRNWPALTFAAFITGAIMMAALLLLQPDKDLFIINTLNHATPVKALAEAHVPASTFQLASSKNAEAAHENLTEAMPILASESAEKSSAKNNKSASIEQLEAHIAIAAQGNELPTNTGIAMETDRTDEVVAASLLASFKPAPDNQILLSATNATLNIAELSDNIPFTANSVSVTNPNDGTLNSSDIQKLPAKRWSLQYYATPSFSFRLLNEDKTFDKSLFSNGLIAANTFSQVGDVVRQRHDIGIEAGVAAKYQVTAKLRVKAGLQLNYRSFNIDAYQLNSLQSTTLRLRQGNNYDSVLATSNMGNIAGNSLATLTNRFVQISIPIGFDLEMAKWGNTSFMIGTTIQPTYNLSQHAWQLSNDFQYYVQQPSLLRSFNLNSAVEAFFQFQTKGGLHWQVGPQIRYQLLSTTQNAYPIKEHLIDYGFKIGVTKTLQ